uniref:hypothetical protein n=1 Tax=Nocardia alni TaxID=2815723 RepID=UPI001C22905B
MAQSVDAMLDDAAGGLQYFAQFIEEYKRAYGGYYGGHDLDFLYARYDEQRGMDLDKLTTTANGLQSALKDVDQEWSTQTGLSQQMSSLWQGTASNSAQDMFRQQLSQAGDDKTKSRALMDAINAAIPGLRSTVQDKANFVKGLVGDGGVLSGGKTPAQVDTIISGASMGLSDGTIISRLQDIFPDQKPGGSFGATFSFAEDPLGEFGIYSGSEGYGARLKGRCQDWLAKVFKPDFEGKVGAFIAHCNTTDSAITQAYTAVTQAAQQVTHKPFVRPAGTQAPSSQPG